MRVTETNCSAGAWDLMKGKGKSWPVNSYRRVEASGRVAGLRTPAAANSAPASAAESSGSHSVLFCIVPDAAENRAFIMMSFDFKSTLLKWVPILFPVYR